MISPLPDFGLIRGEPVEVLRRTVTYDEHMERVESWERERVENVLVLPGASSDVRDAARPDGTKVALTLGFPKGYTASLRGCRVEVRGEAYAVVGDPKPATPGNVPGPWNRNAEVEAIRG